jgi:hypothetical protein
MRKKILSFFLILFIIATVVALTEVPYTKDSTTQEVTGHPWKNWTVRRLELAQDPITGGWNGDVSFTLVPTLYATYHGALALALLNLSPSHPQRTRELLRNYEGDLYNGRGYFSVVDVYYLLTLFREFNLSPGSREAIENLILRDMKKSNETFMYAEDLVLLNSPIAKNVSMSLWLSLKPEHSLSFVWDFLQLRGLLVMSGYSTAEIPNYTRMHELARAVFDDASRRVEDINFYGLYTLARFMKEENIKNETLRGELLARISKYKCPDGSYSDTAGAERGSIDTTHWAVEMITYLGGDVGADTVRYLRSLESPLGGFIGVPYRIIPNPLDTAFSVMVLRLLNSTVSGEEKVRDYLISGLSEESKPSIIWAEYRALRALGVPRSELRGIVKPRLQDFITNLNLSAVYRDHYILKDVYYLLVTSRELGIEIDPGWKKALASFVLGLRDDDGGFGDRISRIKIVRLETTLYSVLILNELGYGYRDEKTVKFIESNRRGALWWSLPITRYALLALRSMGAKVENKEGIVRAIKMRECPYGFFSYAPYENPKQGDPIATFLALDTLKLLGYR